MDESIDFPPPPPIPASSIPLPGAASSASAPTNLLLDSRAVVAGSGMGSFTIVRESAISDPLQQLQTLRRLLLPSRTLRRGARREEEKGEEKGPAWGENPVEQQPY